MAIPDTPPVAPSARFRHPFPQWVRYAAIAWLIVWAVTYEIYWGASSFLYLCDMAVVFTCIGLWIPNWTASRLLISSQAVCSVLIDSFWAIDVVVRLIAHRHIIGGTEYLFDPHYPVWVRSMSLFHVALPPLLLWATRRNGYDSRGFRLQALIAALAMIVSRFAGPDKNINFAFTGPIVNQQWGPAPVHLACMFFGLVLVIYWPTHLLMLWWDRRARQ